MSGYRGLLHLVKRDPFKCFLSSERLFRKEESEQYELCNDQSPPHTVSTGVHTSGFGLVERNKRFRRSARGSLVPLSGTNHRVGECIAYQ